MSNKKYYIYGNHSVSSAILNPKRVIHSILVSTNYNQDDLLALLNKNNTTKHLTKKIRQVSNKELSQILNTTNNHQGIAILTDELQQIQLNDLIQQLKNKPKTTLAVLDQVTDPNNIGAILRSAAAFDIDALIIPKYNNAQENSSIAKSASGALEVVPLIQVTNLSNALTTLKQHQFWVAGLDSNANTSNINNLKDYNRLVLVFGNEHKGLRTLTKSNCDIIAKIPFMKNKIESLNLSNAAAITFYLRYES